MNPLRIESIVSWDDPYDGLTWCGKVMDIRGSIVFVAVLGWPRMFQLWKHSPAIRVVG